MKGSWAIMIAAMLLCSCRSSQPTTNPFLRTTVAPPATGQAAVVVPTEPYSTTPPIITTPPPPAMPVTTMPVQGAPGTPAMTPAVPRGGDKTSPPGGSYIFHQSKIEQPKKAAGSEVELASATEPMPQTSSPPATTLKLTAEDPQSSPAAENQVLKLAMPATAVEQTAAEPTDDAHSRGHPVALAAAGESANSVRIVGEASDAASAAKPTKSPAAESTAAASPVLRVTAGEPAPIRIPAFREVSSNSGATAKLTAGTEPSSTANTAQILAAGAPAATSGVVQTAFQPPATAGPSATGASQYAHRADYSELSGRLEYSQTARQWKLRYIPIDGETDKYGGSVILSDAALLSSYQAGDLVTIRGALAPSATSQAGFSPSYQAHQITRIGR